MPKGVLFLSHPDEKGGAITEDENSQDQSMQLHTKKQKEKRHDTE